MGLRGATEQLPCVYSEHYAFALSNIMCFTLTTAKSFLFQMKILEEYSGYSEIIIKPMQHDLVWFIILLGKILSSTAGNGNQNIGGLSQAVTSHTMHEPIQNFHVH